MQFRYKKKKRISADIYPSVTAVKWQSYETLGSSLMFILLCAIITTEG